MMPDFKIRPFDSADTDAVISVWEKCDLTRPWNNPRLDIERKLSCQPELFLVGVYDGQIIATAMFGYDGHRGWLYYFAVSPEFQKQGYGRQLLDCGENALIKMGCPKINFQVRTTNTDVVNFYTATGYQQDDVISFGKRLIDDTSF